MSVQSTDFSTVEYFSCQILCLWCMLSCFSHVRLFVTRWTVPHQAPLSMGCSRSEYWSGLPCPPPGDLPDPGIEHASLSTPALQADSLPLSHWALRLCMNLCIPIDVHDKVQTCILWFCSTKPFFDPAFHSFMPVFSLVTRLHCHLSL